MRAVAFAAASLLLAYCASAPPAHRCEKRDFEPATTEDAEKALAERVAAARARGRERWIASKRLDPDFPSEPERLVARRVLAHAETCYRYGWYDEAVDEYETAAATLTER